MAPAGSTMQCQQYLDQRTSTAPATGMSRIRWKRRSLRRVATTPQFGDPRRLVCFNDDLASAIIRRGGGDDAIVGQVEDAGGSAERHTVRLRNPPQGPGPRSHPAWQCSQKLRNIHHAPPGAGPGTRQRSHCLVPGLPHPGSRPPRPDPHRLEDRNPGVLGRRGFRNLRCILGCCVKSWAERRPRSRFQIQRHNSPPVKTRFTSASSQTTGL